MSIPVKVDDTRGSGGLNEQGVRQLFLDVVSSFPVGKQGEENHFRFNIDAKLNERITFELLTVPSGGTLTCHRRCVNGNERQFLQTWQRYRRYRNRYSPSCRTSSTSRSRSECRSCAFLGKGGGGSILKHDALYGCFGQINGQCRLSNGQI